MRTFIAISLLWGVTLTGVTMLIPYEHCMDGDARGIPFGIITPSCGPAWGPAVMFEPDTKNGQMFDFGTLMADVVLWTAIAAFARRCDAAHSCSSVQKPTKTVLTRQQAHNLAEQLAVARYGDLFEEPAFRNTQPPVLDSIGWRWRWRRGSGVSDIEILVSFAPDGGSPLVLYQVLGSGEYVPR